MDAMFSDNLLSTKKVRLTMRSFFLALVALINAASAEQEKVFIHFRVLQWFKADFVRNFDKILLVKDPKCEEHGLGTFCGTPFSDVDVSANWNDLQMDEFWCNDANYGLRTNEADIKFVSQADIPDENNSTVLIPTCTISISDHSNGTEIKSTYDYENCDCSDPGNYDFKNTGRFQIENNFTKCYVCGPACDTCK